MHSAGEAQVLVHLERRKREVGAVQLAAQRDEEERRQQAPARVGRRLLMEWEGVRMHQRQYVTISARSVASTNSKLLACRGGARRRRRPPLLPSLLLSGLPAEASKC